jgi:hypothetical protein
MPSWGNQRANAWCARVQRLPEPLIIRPLAKAEYFEVRGLLDAGPSKRALYRLHSTNCTCLAQKRTPFNAIAFLKSPYGLMISAPASLPGACHLPYAKACC